MTEWSEEQIDLLKLRWSQGASASVIADELGGWFSRSAVLGKVHRLQIDRPGSPTLAGTTGPRSQPQPNQRLKRATVHRTIASSGVRRGRPRKADREHMDARRNADAGISRIPPPPKPPRVPMDELPELTKGTVKYLDRLSGVHCAWPYWDDQTPAEERMFCGRAIEASGQYCWVHRRKAAG